MHSHFEEMMLSAPQSELNYKSCKEYNVQATALMRLGEGGTVAMLLSLEGEVDVQHVSKEA
jgi:hypothetical protein